MNNYMRVRKQNKMSREELAKKMLLPIGYIVEVERFENPVPSMHYQRNFVKIFNISEEDLKNDQ